MHPFSVFGSDARQTHLANLLQQSGYSVVYTTDEICLLPTILLPVPSILPNGIIRGTKQPFEDFLKFVPPGTAIWGSGLTQYQPQAAAQHIFLKNYSDDPQFAEQNALPTAEGALQLAMERLPTTIAGSQFLVIGCGRIGLQLSAMLTALGGTVTLASRGTPTVPYRIDRTAQYQFPLDTYDVVFNTAPAPVFHVDHCKAVRDDCLLIDLASAPGGIAADSSRPVLHALGLPAKSAPKTAAKIMLSIILKEEST